MSRLKYYIELQGNAQCDQDRCHVPIPCNYKKLSLGIEKCSMNYS